MDITADTASPGGQVAGTGMVITSNGEVLTNNHVIDDTVNIRAQIDGTGTVYTVKVIGYDLNDDLALVQLVGASNLPTVPIGDATKLSVGDPITVLGNALGKGGTPAVVGGTVAQLDTQITASDDSGNTETLTGMIQVSAAIQPGDSGGPEVNAAGQVIGITTAGQTNGNLNQQSASTTGFAIPINKAMQVVSEIRSGSGPNIHIGNAALLGVAVSHVQPGINNSLPNCTNSQANDRRLDQRRHRELSGGRRRGDRLRANHMDRRKLHREQLGPAHCHGRVPCGPDRDPQVVGRLGGDPHRHGHAGSGQLPGLI